MASSSACVYVDAQATNRTQSCLQGCRQRRHMKFGLNVEKYVPAGGTLSCPGSLRVPRLGLLSTYAILNDKGKGNWQKTGVNKTNPINREVCEPQHCHAMAKYIPIHEMKIDHVLPAAR